MAFDYTGVQADAISLVSEFGRSVTFQRFDQSAGNVLKPWDGPSDVTASPDATLTADAVFVEPESAVELGLTVEDSELFKTSEKIMIVAPPTTFTTDDLETFNAVIDGTIRWRIEQVTKLKPGATTLLYFVGVAR